MATDDEEMPRIGAGSAQWFKKMVDGHHRAAAIGSFIGGLFGKLLNPPSVKFNPRGDMIIEAGKGVEVLIDRNNLGLVAAAIQRRTATFHLGTSDDDLPPLAGNKEST